jgi:predicted RNase H-like nuclease (RuvC/YqgF family)
MGQAEKAEKADRASLDGLDHMFVSESKLEKEVIIEETRVEYVEVEGLDIFDAGSEHETQEQSESGDSFISPAGIFELISEKDRAIMELYKKLESLTWRNGYLEHQVETQAQEIRLLTTRKGSLWKRVKSWFQESNCKHPQN